MIKNLISVIAAVVTVGSLTAMQPVAPQDPPAKKRQIKVVTVKDGVATVIDTTFQEGGLFRFEGDKLPVDMDKLIEGIIPDVRGRTFLDSSGNVFVIRKERPGGMAAFRRPGELPDSLRREIRIERREGDQGRIMVLRDGEVRRLPGMPGRELAPPVPPGAMRLRMLRERQANMIDPADPGVITYKKKKLSGGREKITIIRKEVPEK